MSALFIAFCISVLVQPPLLALLRHADVLDHPSFRSSHVRPTVRGGGIGVAVAVVAAVVLTSDRDAFAVASLAPPIVVLVALALLGTLEDVRGVPARWRLGCQIAAGAAGGAAAVVYGAPAWVGVAIAIVVVVYANAFNFMDGLNGISGLNAAFAGLVYAAIAVRFDAPTVALFALIVAGAALGFLPFNFPAARMFLGDSGSYALGGVLAVLAVQCLAAGAPLLLCIAPTSVYLADTGWTLVARARRGEPLMVAHREHAYQRLADSAVGHVDAACTTVLVAAAVTGIVFAAGDAGAGPLLGTCMAAAVLLVYLAVPGSIPLTARRASSPAGVSIDSMRRTTRTRVG